MSVLIDTVGDAQVRRHVEDLAERSRDAKPAMRRVRDILQDATRKQFQTSGSYLGGSWDELKPGTLARKARKGQDARILRATGALEASLTGGKGRRTSATKTQAKVGTSVWYAVFAQSGTKTAPRRPVVGITKRDKLKSSRVIEKFVATGQVF